MDPLDICYQSAGQLSKLIERGEISPVEIIEAHLERIELTEPVLNSFITLTAEQALVSAHKAESEIRSGHYRGPLHGIPVGLKDLFNTGGVKTTSGFGFSTILYQSKTVRWPHGLTTLAPYC